MRASTRDRTRARRGRTGGRGGGRGGTGRRRATTHPRWTVAERQVDGALGQVRQAWYSLCGRTSSGAVSPSGNRGPCHPPDGVRAALLLRTARVDCMVALGCWPLADVEHRCGMRDPAPPSCAACVRQCESHWPHLIDLLRRT